MIGGIEPTVNIDAGGAHPNDHVGPNKLSQTVASLGYTCGHWVPQAQGFSF